MFKNYLLSLYRNITRNRFYTTLNIIGLSVGIAAVIFISLYVQDELSYDKYNTKHERIYRIESDFTISNKHDMFAIVPIPMGPALKIEFPEVEEFVRLTNIGNTLFRYNEKEYYEEDFYLADSTIFDVFTYEFLIGDPKTGLTEPNTIVITEKIAKKYFGKDNPMGEIITSGRGSNYKVTGVIKNLPGNSHLKFDALISTATIAEEVGADDFNSMEPVRFWNIGVYTYLLLKENAGMESIHEKFPAFYDKYMKSIGDSFNASFNLLSTLLAETHFRQGLSAEQPSGNMAYIYIFSAVAIFILLIAAINYMNMATARSANRAKEVGIRKVVGAYRNQLIRQFISESVVLSITALLIAILIVSMLLPDFNNIADKTLSFSLASNPVIFLQALIIAIFVGLVSGSFPAFYLSSFLPVKVLKGSIGHNGRGTGWLRKILVVVQFFIAIVMITGTIVVSSQLNFMKNKDLGFDKENLIVMEIQDTAFRSKVQTFKEELLLNPNIISATNSTGVPGRIEWIQVMKIERESNMEDHAVILAQTDYDFTKVLNLEIVKGRNFDKKMGTDAQEAVIINETAAKEFGWEDPLGKKIHYGFELDGSGGRMLKVVGIVKDFHFKSLHNKIEPVIFFISERPRYFLTCRVNKEKRKEALNFIEAKWNDFNAKRPFDYEYLDNNMDEMYNAEEKIGVIIRIAAILTIFIALLGTLGLSSFIAEQKTKEIGIRKVVGASLGNILKLLYKEFVVLVFIAFILAIPVAWWRLDIWLNTSFIYHQTLQWTYFLFAGLIAIIIGIATISYYIIRAASANPVDAMKYE
ncbi:MAG: ABC transporter permease [Bacteroidetes bacterium]|nr:ABC transporter permease [Bacteroidota bacterium]MBL7104174.1 ABC transporter permease [Bacteroidales bacterium]